LILPYNKKNVLITKKDIQDMLKQYNIHIEVNDLSIYQLALTHKSYTHKHFDQELLDACEEYTDTTVRLQPVSNETLEFYGDSVIGKIVSKYIYLRYAPDEDEGFLTTLKTKLVNSHRLAEFAVELGFTPFILISKQVENLDDGLNRTSKVFKNILEDAFEAFIGALELDAGDKVCEDLIFKMLEKKVDFAEILYNDTNYKNRLLQYYHKMKWGHPIYGEESNSGPTNNREFIMYVLDGNGQRLGQGKGKKKKDGEQMAAKDALEKLKIIKKDENMTSVADSIFI
jgi:dsRNA-specific ribonuclease